DRQKHVGMSDEGLDLFVEPTAERKILVAHRAESILTENLLQFGHLWCVVVRVADKNPISLGNSTRRRIGWLELR
ncbi:hypothetical protein RZS08_58645, partial [Arthrospira platensis SPKY1]|nr:hypothetical protein [Arthrospira platensis SPKY1]